MDSTKCDINFGTESWLSCEIKDNEVFPPGYTVYSWDRDGRGGGVYVYTVFAEIDIKPKRYRQTKRKIPFYKKANWEKIADQMKGPYQYIKDKADLKSVDHLWNIFFKDLLEAIEKYIPHKNCSQLNHPG